MVKTDFFKDIKVSARLEYRVEDISYALKAFGVQVKVVGNLVAQIITQKPGKITGKQYSTLKGFRLFRGIILITWFKLSGKIKG